MKNMSFSTITEFPDPIPTPMLSSRTMKLLPRRALAFNVRTDWQRGKKRSIATVIAMVSEQTDDEGNQLYPNYTRVKAYADIAWMRENLELLPWASYVS